MPGAVVEHTFSQEDFDRFADLSGDNNPIHVDPGFAAGTRFGRTVAHGLLLATVIRGLAGRLVPGGRQVEQDLKFTAPTYAGDAMTFSATVEEQTATTVALAFQVVRKHDRTITCEGTMLLRRGDDDR